MKIFLKGFFLWNSEVNSFYVSLLILNNLRSVWDVFWIDQEMLQRNEAKFEEKNVLSIFYRVKTEEVIVIGWDQFLKAYI